MKNYKAFTLSEVLITLGIIGVVAALTIPMVVSKYRKMAVEANLKKAYSMLNQALLRSEADNGSATTWNYYSIGSRDTEFDKRFFNNYFAPYMNVSNIKFKHALDQYNKSGYKVMNYGGLYGYIFELSNGFAIMPSLQSHPNGTLGDFIVILPNTDRKNLVVGRDVFQFAIKYKNYKYDMSSVKIEPGSYAIWSCESVKNYKQSFINNCKQYVNGSMISYCTMMVYCNDWKIPDDYPVKF